MTDILRLEKSQIFGKTNIQIQNSGQIISTLELQQMAKKRQILGKILLF
jgi:hypothetical protein